MKTILITGATSAIGRALALQYAKQGAYLILQARDKHALQNVVSSCQQQGSQARGVILDLQNIAAVRDWALNEITPDILIANAGRNTHVINGNEDWQQVQALLDVNITATLALVNAMIPRLQAKQNGHIVLMSSLAAFHGLPITPSYCASKSALRAYGQALRGSLIPYNIAVTTVLPGYVKSAMCDAMPGPKPFLWSPEQAASYIIRKLSINPATISFPFPLNVGTWLLGVMPYTLSSYFLRLLGYEKSC